MSKLTSFCLFICFIHLFYPVISGNFVVDIEVVKHPINKVDKRFLSVTVGSGQIKRGFRGFESKKFLTLANGLNIYQHGSSEVYLRFGGSRADDLIYVPQTIRVRRDLREHIDNKVYKFNFTTFDKLYQFASALKWRVIFDLNSLIRNENGTWNPKNAIEFINAVQRHNYSIDYELGNEPDLYPTARNITIPPEELAADFKTLKGILIDLTQGTSKLLGPDMATLTRYKYFHYFLKHLEEDVLDAITFHHYYSASTNVTVKNFTSVSYLDSFLKYTQSAIEIISGSITTFPTPPIWIGETSSTYGGGNPDAGESFAAGFLWLDKLGLAAQLGINTVMRQSLQGAHYSLIDRNYDPCVDYWTSILYKQLVGTEVLWLTGFLQYNRTVRVYGHCVNKENGRGYIPYETIVLIALNVDETNEAHIKLKGDLVDKPVDGFVFTSANGKMNSKLAKLNGKVLEMIDESHLPEMNPVALKQPIILPPLTYGLFVVKNATSIRC